MCERCNLSTSNLILHIFIALTCLSHYVWFINFKLPALWTLVLLCNCKSILFNVNCHCIFAVSSFTFLWCYYVIARAIVNRVLLFSTLDSVDLHRGVVSMFLSKEMLSFQILAFDRKELRCLYLFFASSNFCCKSHDEISWSLFFSKMFILNLKTKWTLFYLINIEKFSLDIL